MRPVRLTMQAFGSYGRRTDVDFTKTSQNLFLITGAATLLLERFRLWRSKRRAEP